MANKVRGIVDRADRSAWQVRIARKDAAGVLHKIARWFPYDPAAPSLSPHGKRAQHDAAAAFAAVQRVALRIEKRPAAAALKEQTLGRWCDEYEREQFDQPTPTRRKKKGEAQERSILHMLRTGQTALLAKPAANLTALDFGLTEAGLRGRMLKAGYKTNTVRRYFALLSTVWEAYGKPYGLVRPFDMKDLPKEDDARTRIVTEDELKRILSQMENRSAGTRAAILFLRWTGARRGEAAKLEWTDLRKRTDAKEGWLAILRDTKTPKRGAVKNRTVPVPKSAMDAIGKLDKKSAKVFDCRADSLTNAWDESCRRAKIHDARLHDLRHTRITELVDGGMAILELAALTGHEDLRMLNRYYNPAPESIARAVSEADRRNAARRQKGRS